METQEELFCHYNALSKKYPVYARIYTALIAMQKKYELLSALTTWQQSTPDSFERVALNVAIQHVLETRWKPGRKRNT